MLGVTLNLLMCDRRGAVYSVQAITSKKYKYSLIDLFYFIIDCCIFSFLNLVRISLITVLHFISPSALFSGRIKIYVKNNVKKLAGTFTLRK